MRKTTLEKSQPLKTIKSKPRLNNVEVTDEWLTQQVQSGKSADSIALTTKTKKSVIYSRLKALGLVKKTKGYRTYNVSKEWLLEQLEEGKTQREIFDSLGKSCNYETLKRILIKHGIYELFEKAHVEKLKEKKYTIEKSVFVELIKKGLNEEAIMKSLKIDMDLVTKYLVKYQLNRLLQNAQKALEDAPKIQEIALKIKAGMSVQKIADEMGEKQHRVGYFVRKYNLNSEELMSTRKKPSKRKGLKKSEFQEKFKK